MSSTSQICVLLHSLRFFFFAFWVGFWFDCPFSIVQLTQLVLSLLSPNGVVWSSPRPNHRTKVHSTELVQVCSERKNYDCCWLPYSRLLHSRPATTNIFAFKLRFNFNLDYVCLWSTRASTEPKIRQRISLAGVVSSRTRDRWLDGRFRNRSTL